VHLIHWSRLLRAERIQIVGQEHDDSVAKEDFFEHTLPKVQDHSPLKREPNSGTKERAECHAHVQE
jgi:hypothetical protein